MRTNLLMTAAAMALLAAPAFADTTPIDSHPVDYTPPTIVGPEKPDLAVPDEAVFDKADPDLNALFERLPLGPPEDSNGFQQQARIEQDGNRNNASANQEGGQEGLAHIRQDGDRNTANILQADDGDNGPAPNPPTTFNGPTNVGIVGQTGDRNSVSIEQTNTRTAGRGNLADVHQFSDDNSAPGDGNEAQIVQGDVLGTRGGRVLTARINQGAIDARAENNFARIQQDGLAANNVSVSAFVDQQSDGNFANISQLSVDDSVVTLNQNGFDGAGDAEANDATISQNGGTELTVSLIQSNTGFGFNPAGTANVADIQQSGDRNSVTATQASDDNFLIVNQFGSDNVINSVQEDDNGFTSNVVDVLQGGHDNEVSVLQNDAPSDAFITQGGSDNKIALQQIATGTDIVGGFTNTADLTQNGHNNGMHVLQQNDGNDAIVNQDGSYNEIALEQRDNSDNGINSADLTQSADVSYSEISVLQRDAENSATVNQTWGTNLTTDIDQSGDSATFALGTGFFTGDVNVADATQAGSDNAITIRQEAVNVGFVITNPTANIAAVDQNGSNNAIFVEQIGEGNDVGEIGNAVVQDGNNLLLQISQVGAGNGAFGSQTGDDSDLTIVQEGLFNEVNFEQAGSDNFATVSQSGAGNDATLVQTTDLNDAYIYQDGNNNDAMITQTVGNTQLAVINQLGNNNSAFVAQ